MSFLDIPEKHGFDEDYAKPSVGIAEALRRLVSGKNHAFFRPHAFQFEAAQKILNGLPLNDLKEKIIALNNNPESSENKEYLSNNLELFEAFPVLKQTYERERPINTSNIDEANKLDVERQDAKLDYYNLVGDGKPIDPQRLKKYRQDTYNLQEWRDRDADLESGFHTESEILDRRGLQELENVANMPPSSNYSEYMSPDEGSLYNMPTGDLDERPDDPLVSGPTSSNAAELPFALYGGPYQGSSGYISTDALAGQRINTDDYGFSERREEDLIARPAPSSERSAEPDERSAEPAFGRALGLNRSEDQIKRDVAISKALDRGDYDAVMRIQEGKEPELDDYSYMDEQRHRYQDGGFVPPEEAPVPVDGPPLPEDDMGFVGSPEEAAVDQVDAAQNGDMGGDNVEADVPEGSFVLNSYAVELAGIKDIEKLIKDAKKFYMEQKQQEGLVSPDAGQEEDIEIRVSEGEYIIPPALVRIIGRDRLEKINKRGIDEFERQQAEETEAGGQEMPQEPQGFMPQEEAAPMQQEMAAPMQQEMAAPMPQGFATGGGVARINISEDILRAALASKPPSAPKPKRQKVAAIAQPRGRQNVTRSNLPQQQSNQPLTGITFSAGGFMQPGANVVPIPRDKPLVPQDTSFVSHDMPPVPRDKPPVPQDTSFVSHDMPPVPQDKPVVQNIFDEKVEQIKEVWLPSERAIISPLLALISKGEGTSGVSGYDVVHGYDKYKTKEMRKQLEKTPLSKMTLEQVQEFQKKLIEQTRGTLPAPASKKHGTGTVGKYQINHTNIKKWLEDKKFDKNTLFSPEIQDQMAIELLKESKLDYLVNNKISFEEFISRLGNIWKPIKDKKIKSEDVRQLIDNALRNFKKMEGGLVPQYQKGTDKRGVVLPSSTVTEEGPIPFGQNPPETGGFLSVSGRHLKGKRKPVGKIITPESEIPVVAGSEDKGFSIEGRLPKNITNKIVDGLRLGGSFTQEEFKDKISADPFFNYVIREEVQSLGLNIGIEDKFDIRLNQTAIKPEGQKTRKQHSASGEFTIYKSPAGKITVGVNAEDFTGRNPRYSGALRGKLKFEEGGFVSA
jgi:hypothetical protein